MQKIFVIEDDENIRNLVKIAMEGYGYQVCAYETAEEALEKYERVLREANAEAAENLRKAGEELEKKIAAREAEKSRRLAEATAENERRTEENRRQTMEQIENIAAELAVRIAGRLELDGLVSAEDVAKTAGRRREHE